MKGLIHFSLTCVWQILLIDLKIAAKCIFKHDTGLVIDEAGSKLPAKSMILCKMTPFIITEEETLNI